MTEARGRIEAIRAALGGALDGIRRGTGPLGRGAGRVARRLALQARRAGGQIAVWGRAAAPHLAALGRALLSLGPIRRLALRGERLARRLSEGRFLRTASYVLLGIIAFAFFLYSRLPYGDIARTVLEQAESSLPVSVRIEGVRPWWLTGVRVDTLELARTLGHDRVIVARLDDLKIRLQILPLLKRVLELKGTGSTLDGMARGDFRQGPQRASLELEARDLDLSKSEYARKVMPLPPRGVLNGHLSLDFERGKGWLGKGGADLAIEGGGFDEGMVLGLVKVPSLSVPKVSGKMKMDAGKMEVGPIALSGGDLDGDVKGSVMLQPEIPRSAVNFRAHLKPSDKVFSLLASNLPLLGLIRDPQGFVNFSVMGTLGQPNLSP